MSGRSIETDAAPNATHDDQARVVDRLGTIFLTQLDLEITDPDADLLSTGLIDSLGLVTLLLALEQEFGVEIAIEDFEMDDFRSISNIADFVIRHRGLEERSSDQ